MTCRNTLLRTSWPLTISPIFSSPPITHPISPSKISSPRQTNFGTNPHSSPKPHSPKRNPVPSLDASSLSHLSCLDPFRSSTGPSVRWSPFHISYAFLFGFRSCSTNAAQYWLSVPFSHSTSYDSLISFLIGSAMWQPTLNPT